MCVVRLKPNAHAVLSFHSPSPLDTSICSIFMFINLAADNARLNTFRNIIASIKRQCHKILLSVIFNHYNDISRNQSQRYDALMIFILHYDAFVVSL